MRVLHVLRPAIGGMKEQALSVCSGLREAGWDVEVACPPDSPIAAEAAERGFLVHAVDLVGPLRPVADARVILQVRSLVRSGSYDVVHVHGFKAGFVGRVGATLGGCRARLVTVHNHVLYRNDISAFTKWRYRKAERILSRWTERIIAVSDSIRDELIEAYGLSSDIVVTVHNGIDFTAATDAESRDRARRALGVGPNETLVGTACRFAPQKGLSVLVDAIEIVCEAREDVRFVIGGEGPLESDIRARLDAVGLLDSVALPGSISDMPLFLSGLDLYVSASLSEGLPLALVEAGASGLAVVATSAGGTPEVVRDGESGILVAAGDARGLAEAMLHLLDDAEERRSMGDAGRSIATREFTTERMVGGTLAVYGEALRSALG